MHPTATCYVGADVAQDTIAFCGFTAATIENTPAKLDSYLTGLPVGTHVICEATGRHHHLLRDLCAKRAVALSVLNPAHARSFARSFGKLEKTDAVDARLLRRFGEERRPVPSLPPEPGRQALLDLLMVRHVLVSDIADHRRRNRLLSAESARELRELVTMLTKRVRALDQRLEAWLESPAADYCREQVHALCLTKGVGVLSAIQLVGYLPELGCCNRRQIAKLAGLAPLPWDSGDYRGIRRIQHGRAPARRVLYQCAVVAARWNENLRPHYQKLRARGMPAKPAYCAIARKLLVFLNASLRQTSATAS